MEKILKFLNDKPVFYYATVDGDKPRVRPFGFFMEHNGRLYIGMGTHKECYHQTIANPNIEMCTANSEGRWVRIRGKAVEDRDESTLLKAFEVYPSLKNIYNDTTGYKMACFYIVEGLAEFADMSGNFEKITF